MRIGNGLAAWIKCDGFEPSLLVNPNARHAVSQYPAFANVTGGDRSIGGAATSRGAAVTFAVRVGGEAHCEVRYAGGFRVWAPSEPLALGDRSHRLRIVDAVHDGASFRATVQGLAGARYAVNLDAPAGFDSLTGAREVGREGSVSRLEVVLPAAAAEWTTAEIVVQER